MNYDAMSAHEILVMAVTTAYEEDYLPIIESALRKAVIREERKVNDDRMGYNGH